MVCRQIRKKNIQPKGGLPEGLMKFSNRHGFFHLGSKDMDSVVMQTIGVYVQACNKLTKPQRVGNLLMTNCVCVILVCFRELCGLCWMLHVRDQLTVSCRRYQAVRSNTIDSQVNKMLTELYLCVFKGC